jgi:L-asparaginase|tara:strand:- start:510 stop:1523 length:1014 start_codon:yes stop_codon:yes gene_type:complete
MAKRIHILATGGTIAGTADTRGGYAAGQVSVEALLDSLPSRPQDMVVSFEQLANVGSQSITNDIWYELANRINKISNENLADGIVVTHGTDTMEETAYFLNLVTLGQIPVVLTGAMKPADAFSPDGPENLLSALYLAANTAAANLGVLVVMNSTIHSARYIQKTGSNQDNAFQSIPFGPVGTQRGHTTIFFANGLSSLHTAHTAFTNAIQTGALNLQDKFSLPAVNILYAHAGMQDEMLKHWMAMPHQGIVVAGVGSGNISRTLELLLAAQVAKGIVVVRSTRLAFGHVARNVEVDDDQQGFVVAQNLNPAKARILLQLALALKLPLVQIQALYNTH